MKKYIPILSLLFVLNSLHAQHVRFDSQPVNMPAGSEVDFVGIGDVNGDGLNDIVAATTFDFYAPNNYNLVVWLQGTNGQLHPPVFTKHTFPGVVTCLAVKDIDQSSSNKRGTGRADVIVGIGKKIFIYDWSVNTLVARDSFITAEAKNTDGVTVADFDADGLLDIGVSHWGDSIAIIYQNKNLPEWEVKRYNVTTNGYGHVTSGSFGTIKKNALIATNGQGNSSPVVVLYFDASRNISNKHEFTLPVYQGHNPASAYSAVIVHHGKNKVDELWVTYGGNKPSSKVAIWRGLQQMPDSSFDVYDVPEAIATGNLDCDEGNEQVIVHAGWMRASVIADSIYPYKIFDAGHYYQEGVALGDVNNDGRADLCLAHENATGDLQILYNITPACVWPTNVLPISDEQNLLLYPNPTHEFTTVTYNGNGHLNVYNTSGVIKYTTPFRQKADIDTHGWPAGIYYLVLQNDNGNTITQKLLVQ